MGTQTHTEAMYCSMTNHTIIANPASLRPYFRLGFAAGHTRSHRRTSHGTAGCSLPLSRARPLFCWQTLNFSGRSQQPKMIKKLSLLYSLNEKRNPFRPARKGARNPLFCWQLGLLDGVSRGNQFWGQHSSLMRRCQNIHLFIKTRAKMIQLPEIIGLYEYACACSKILSPPLSLCVWDNTSAWASRSVWCGQVTWCRWTGEATRRGDGGQLADWRAVLCVFGSWNNEAITSHTAEIQRHFDDWARVSCWTTPHHSDDQLGTSAVTFTLQLVTTWETAAVNMLLAVGESTSNNRPIFYH